MSDWSIRRSGLVVVGLSSLVFIAACGSSAGSHASPTTASPGAATSAIGAPSGIPDPPAPDRWTTTTDPATGVSFALPGQAKLESRTGNAKGTTPTARKYQVDVGGGLGLAVTFSEAAAADYSAEGLDFVADSLVEQFKAAGADDAVLTNRHHTMVADRPALDFQLSFTAKTGQKSIWFIRIIGDRARAVQLQSIAFVAPSNEALVTPIVEKYHRQLIDAVRLP